MSSVYKKSSSDDLFGTASFGGGGGGGGGGGSCTASDPDGDGISWGDAAGSFAPAGQGYNEGLCKTRINNGPQKRLLCAVVAD